MEIEIKYGVSEDAANAAISRLRELGGGYLKDSREIDTYFNVTGRDSMSTKECLRIRESSEGGYEMTYKPPTQKLDQKGDYFAKKETNISITDPNDAKYFLHCLGNTVLAVVDKSRQYFTLGECTVCLDKIQGLGSFIEVENDGEDPEIGLTKVKDCARLLGLSDSDIVRDPYRDLVITHSQSSK